MGELDKAAVQAKGLGRYLSVPAFVVGIAAITFIFFGIEGTVVWILPAFVASAMNRRKPKGEREFIFPALLWAALFALMLYGRSLG